MTSRGILQALLLLGGVASGQSRAAAHAAPPAVPYAAPYAAPSAGTRDSLPDGLPAGQAGLPPVTGVTHDQLKAVVAGDSGSIVLVNVWATWCKPCKEELPSLVKLSKAYREKGLHVVLVSADDLDSLENNVRPMLMNLKVDVPSYIIADSSDEAFMDGFAPDWGGALPTTFLFDQQGTLKETLVGERTYEQFRKSVEKLQPK